MKAMKVSCVLVAASCAGVSFGGPLNPPAGPVAPTLKTLDDVEPRIPIDPSEAPYVITDPGSYYLTGNITADAGVGVGVAITIDAPDVTLDLRGFAIQNSLDSAFTRGVLVQTNQDNAVIMNGTIRGTTDDGIDAANADRCQALGVRAEACGGRGFEFGNYALVLGCTAEGCFSDGIDVGSFSVVADCIAANNGVNGIRAEQGSTVARCTSAGNATTGISGSSYCVFDACIARGNPVIGIQAGEQSTVTNCTARDCGTGFFMSFGCTVSNCASYSNDGGQNADGNGFETVSSGSVAFSNCSAVSNALRGFEAGSGSSLEGCAARSNQNDGFFLGSGASARGCTAAFNSGDGFDCNSGAVVDGCSSANNDGNGYILDAGAIARGCSARMNTIGFSSTGSALVSGCTSVQNDQRGFDLGDASRVMDSVAHSNTFEGIVVGNSGAVVECTATENGDKDGGPDGISTGLGSIVRGCSAANNAGAGIRVFDFSFVEHNLTRGRGISVTATHTRVSDNVAWGDSGDTAFGVPGGRNYVIRNHASSLMTLGININNHQGPTDTTIDAVLGSLANTQ